MDELNIPRKENIKLSTTATGVTIQQTIEQYGPCEIEVDFCNIPSVIAYLQSALDEHNNG